MSVPVARPPAEIVVRTSLEQVQDLVALADAVIGPHPDMSHAAYYEWLYDRNPAGKAIQASAYLGGQMVAHYAVVPIRWRTPVGDRLVGLGVNALTRLDAQGRGLFARLVAQADRVAAEHGITATYVMPGPESEPWFSTVLRYQRCGELALFVRPARLARLAANATGWLRLARPLLPIVDLVLRPIASRWRAHRGRRDADLRLVTDIDDDFDALWRRAGADWTLGAVRDRTFLRWRFSSPTRAYRLMGAWVDGRLVASVAYRAKETHHLAGVMLGSIVDVLAEPTRVGDDMAALLVADAVARMATEGADVTICQIDRGARLASALRRNGFFRAPGRHAAFRPVLTRGLEADSRATSPASFTGADYDMG
jgi:GNAT superfamily N-acetyltransferase